jgi:hypothetical protein
MLFPLSGLMHAMSYLPIWSLIPAFTKADELHIRHKAIDIQPVEGLH